MRAGAQTSMHLLLAVITTVFSGVLDLVTVMCCIWSGINIRIFQRRTIHHLFSEGIFIIIEGVQHPGNFILSFANQRTWLMRWLGSDFH